MHKNNETWENKRASYACKLSHLKLVQQYYQVLISENQKISFTACLSLFTIILYVAHSGSEYTLLFNENLIK